MGHKYHSKVPDARSRGTAKTKEQIVQAFDYALAHPEVSLVKIGPLFGLGTSTMANWLVLPSRSAPNSHVVAWLKGHHGQDGSGPTRIRLWDKLRHSNSIDQQMRSAVAGVVLSSESIESMVLGNDRLVSPQGIGTFVPGTTDDLLVVKQEALDVKAKADVISQSAHELAIAIDTVRDWLGTTDKLQLALGKIQELERQLRSQDEVVKRFQQQKLASNQVHSTD